MHSFPPNHTAAPGKAGCLSPAGAPASSAPLLRPHSPRPRRREGASLRSWADSALGNIAGQANRVRPPAKQAVGRDEGVPATPLLLVPPAPGASLRSGIGKAISGLPGVAFPARHAARTQPARRFGRRDDAKTRMHSFPPNHTAAPGKAGCLSPAGAPASSALLFHPHSPRPRRREGASLRSGIGKAISGLPGVAFPAQHGALTRPTRHFYRRDKTRFLQGSKP